MSSFIKTTIFILLCLTLIGCEKAAIDVEENENGQVKLIELEEITSGLEHEIALLKTELSDREKKIEELNQINQQLTEEMESLQYMINYPDFNVFEEKLIINNPILLSPTSMDIGKVKKLLGEPDDIEESIEAHGSGMVWVLNYEEASFTFNKDDENERIKWYTIKSPRLMTNRGITVGSTRNEVVKAYGNSYPIYHEDENRIIIGEKTGISFDLESDIVKEISVWFVYE